jgi:hypothetical protein
MKTKLKISRFIFAVAVTSWSCSNQDVTTSSTSVEQLSIDVAQTSGQLASGTSFSIRGSSTDTTGSDHGGKGKHGPKGNRKHPGALDGLNLLAPTDELLAIVDAESASDIRGLRMSKTGGATITHYNASGAQVSIPLLGLGTQGCSFSGHQFPEYDSLLATIVKTVVDFGTGVTFKKDTIEITRAGKIIIERTKSGSTITEATTFDGYSVNGTGIEGIKTRISTFDATTGNGSSNTSVSNGRLTFVDGSVAVWTSTKSRVSAIELGDDGRPESGTITTEVNTSIVQSGTVIYSHRTSTPLVENVACEGRRRGPVSGILETIYRANTISVDYGDGSCTNRTITINFNGTTTTKTIGG